MLNPAPDYPPRPHRHLYAVRTDGTVTKRRRLSWLDVVEWLLVPVAVAAVAYAATGRADVVLLVLACCLLTLLLARPLVAHRIPRTR